MLGGLYVVAWVCGIVLAVGGRRGGLRANLRQQNTMIERYDTPRDSPTICRVLDLFREHDEFALQVFNTRQTIKCSGY